MMMKPVRITEAVLAAALLLFPACSDDSPGNNNNLNNVTGDGLFVEGCPVPGQAVAKQITHPDLRMDGPDALGGQGDWLLMNEQAAYIIQGVDDVKTYYHYAGIPIDAVALNGCEQAALERYEEIGLMIVQADLGNYEQSVVRAFKGESIEVISDGSDGGEARVRVTGVDDRYWLVEYELIKYAFDSGNPKSPSEPYGIEVTVDYVLQPDSPVLHMELQLHNLEERAKEFVVGAIATFGDTTESFYFAQANLSIAGFTADYGLPWIAATSGDGAWAFATRNANMGTAAISGIEVLLDIDQFFDALLLAPVSSGNPVGMALLLSVGDGGINTAVRHLQPVNPEAIPDLPHTLHPFSGQVVLSGHQQGVVGARVDIQLENVDGAWMTVDGFFTDSDGNFSGEIPDFGDANMQYRAVARGQGMHDSEAEYFNVPSTTSVTLTMNPGGALQHDIRDESDEPIPAKITLYRSNGSVAHRFYATGGQAIEPVPAGTYDVSVTRGFEYTTWQGSVDIQAEITATLDATLARVVDTTGWLGMDGHVHAQKSPDSQVLVPDRIKTAAAEGLDVLVSTDHEVPNDWSWGVDETGLGDWVVTVVGQEVTATLPEHTNMYPVVPTDHPRGGFVEWYGLDIDEIYAAERARGAGVVALNHPRLGCNYMCIIDYDRLTGQARMTDPTLLGLPSDAVLWSWSFDTIEYMNDSKDPFLHAASPRDSGIFDDWMSFLNLGHKKTAMAVTDVHGINSPGDPRTYFPSSTDEPGLLDETELVDAIVEGRALCSSGAFARVAVDETGLLGDTITTADATVDLSVHIEAIPEIDITYFMVFVNCDEVLKVAATNPDGVVKYDGTLEVGLTQDAHIVVLGFGQNPMPRGLQGYNAARIPRFTTNAIYVDVDGNGVYDPPGGKTCSYTIGPP